MRPASFFPSPPDDAAALGGLVPSGGYSESLKRIDANTARTVVGPGLHYLGPELHYFVSCIASHELHPQIQHDGRRVTQSRDVFHLV